MTGDEGVPPIDDWNRLLDGRVAVFTGGGDGIGAGIARLFARHGALVEVAEIDRERADRVRAEISGTGGRIRSHVVDVTVDDGVTRLAEIVLAEHGRVDVLVNNVGDSRPLVPFAESPPDSWQRMYEINLRHVFAVTRAFVPSMIAAHRGSIVTGHSVDGMRGYPKDPVSGAMKAAAAHFTTCLAVELIVDDGRVVGAVAETDGARRAIRARRGVLLAAGGVRAERPDAGRIPCSRNGIRHHGRATQSGPGTSRGDRGGREHKPDGPGLVVARTGPPRRSRGVRVVLHWRDLRRPEGAPVRQRVHRLRQGQPRDHPRHERGHRRAALLDDLRQPGRRTAARHGDQRVVLADE